MELCVTPVELRFKPEDDVLSDDSMDLEGTHKAVVFRVCNLSVCVCLLDARLAVTLSSSVLLWKLTV